MNQNDGKWRNPGPSDGGGGNWNNNRGYGYHGQRTPRRPYRGGYNRSPSPYGGGGFRQNSPFHPPPPFATSTPYRQYRPPFQGGGRGRGRFNSPRNMQGELGIEAWVSPEMWEDPWKDLMSGSYNEGVSEVTYTEDEITTGGTGSEYNSSVTEFEQSSVSVTKFASSSMEEGSSDTSGIEDPSQVLGVSDMVMRSDISTSHETTSDPLPDISLTLPSDKTEPSTKDQEDLVS